MQIKAKKLSTMYQHIIDQFIQQEILPDAYRQDITQWYLPLVPELQELRNRNPSRPLLLGINGAQGTGKSTLAKLLVRLLEVSTLRAVALSLDDFYLGKTQRIALGKSQHPLLVTRGVPGTHDVALLLQTLDRLASAGEEEQVPLPAFDKANDDRVDPSQWQHATGPVDIIILDGWCVGVQPQEATELQTPVNALEREEDQDWRWRAYVNAQLAGAYQQVFARLDTLLMLQAPDFEQVLEWRSLQEQKLRLRTGTLQNEIMDDLGVQRFIQHFERLTRHCLRTLPQRADIVFLLNEDHRVVQRIDNPGIA